MTSYICKISQYSKLVVLAAMLVTTMVVKADKVKEITGTATITGTAYESQEQMKQRALECARLNALVDEYGVSVNQSVFTQQTSSNGQSSEYVDDITETSVNGEWIADTATPAFDMRFNDNQEIVITCTVKIKARKKSNERVDFDATVLKNQPAPGFASNSFSAGDLLYLYVKAPVDGYLTVYLVDDQQNVYNLLPYHADQVLSREVKKDMDYIFFDPNSRGAASSNTMSNVDSDIDQIYLTTDKEIERNELYVIFSPNAYNKAKDHFISAEVPSMLSKSDFLKWLTDSQKRDSKMNVKHFSLEITNGK